MITWLNRSDVRESWEVFFSSFYTRIVLLLPETLPAIVIEINESFTVSCGVIIESAC